MKVVRDGVVVDVPTAQLVVGDIVEVNIGDKIPADMRLLSVDQMKVHQITKTGQRGNRMWLRGNPGTQHMKRYLHAAQ